jgi:hypothetical protein
MLCTLGRPKDGVLLVSPLALHVVHMAILACGDIVVGIRGLKHPGLKRPNAWRTTLLAIVGQHKFRKSALHVEI